MTEAQTLSYHPGAPLTIYCSQCGQAMRVAPQHVNVAVACPHCRQPVEPWRMTGGQGQQSAADPVAPPPPPYDAARIQRAFDGTGYSSRNRWVAGALGILLGTFGVHRFYLGHTGVGLVQVLITVCSGFMLSWAVAIWAFIEGILCFCGAMRDADGLPLSG